VQLGLALPQLDGTGAPLAWSEVVVAARRAEERGFSSIWVDDHPGPRGPDPVVALGGLARITRRVGLGVLAFRPTRNPAVLAKELATLDVVSGGRLVVGVGAAGSGDEATPAVTRLAETLQVVRGMWGGQPFTFHGSTAETIAAPCLPRPVQVPGPQLLVAGSDDAVVDVAASHADGWVSGWTTSVGHWKRCSARLSEACAAAGRDPSEVSRSVALSAASGLSTRGTRGDRGDGRRTLGEAVEELRAWESAGAAVVVVGPGATPFSSVSEPDLDLWATACSLLQP